MTFADGTSGDDLSRERIETLDAWNASRGTPLLYRTPNAAMTDGPAR